MRSKTSYFNLTLFKKNLTRFWPLWGGVSALGALLPLYLLMALLENGRRLGPNAAMEATVSYYHVLVYFVPILSLFYAALCALAVWHYLYNARSVGMFHSLPITRKGLFVTNFLSGMAMMLIPYAVVGGLLILLSLVMGAFAPVGILVTILGVLGDSFFFFAAATVIIFITGNPFAYAAFYFIFHFIAAGAEWLICLLMSEFYFGVEQTYQGVAEFLCPTMFLMDHISVNTEYVRTVTAEGWIERGDIQSVTLENGWIIGVYALAGAALLGCAWLLYRCRRSESAGDVVAVGWMKPVFRYGVALCAALSGGMALYALFFIRFNPHSTVRVVPMILCMVVAGVIGYYIASMLLAKSLRVFKGSGKGVLITAAASAAICLIIAADPFGVEAWVPGAGDVGWVNLRIYGGYGRSLYVDLEDPAAIEKVVGLHQALAADRDALEDLWNTSAYRTSVQVGINYQTEKGRAERYYSIALPEDEAERPAVLQQAAALVSDPAIQEVNIFDWIMSDDILDCRLTGGYAGDVYNTKTQDIEGVDLTLEQAKELEAAVRRDIQAGHFGKTMFLPSYDEYVRSIYFGDLQLNYNLTWAPEPGYSDRPRDGSRTVSFQVSIYCTETLKVLEDLGILDGARHLLTEQEYENWRNQDYGDPWDYEIYAGDYDPYSMGPMESSSVAVW